MLERIDNKATFIVISIIYFLISSCQKSIYGPEDWIKWANNKKNGLIKQTEFGGVMYTARLRPRQYQIARAHISNDSDLMQRVEKDSNIELVLKMEPTDKRTNILTIRANTREEAIGRTVYYNDQFQNHVYLILNKDTLRPVNFIYERLYNLSPSQSFVFGFHPETNQTSYSTIKFGFDDQALNTGLLLLEFDKNVLIDLPSLDYIK